jgi:phosphonate transport system substrate-binding protein
MSVQRTGDRPVATEVAKLHPQQDPSNQGKRILKGMETAPFLATNAERYSVVRDFIDRFERDVRRVEEP